MGVPALSVVAAFGGGTNSYAYIIGMWERGEPIDLILFSDTGGEKPNTYRNIEIFQDWLAGKGFPPITVVRKEGLTLEQDCLNRKALPSIAYGFKSCSDHFKIRPQQAYLKANNIEVTQMLIGYDAGEPQRVRDIPGNRYPLIEWGWGREECIEAIERVGLPLPGKSACFFCPSSKKREIMLLRRDYPDLAARAVAMEKNADLTMVKGLGRSFAWGDLYEADDAQSKLFPESPIEQDCGCYDGEAE
jgi:hypothetical protein